MLSAVTTLSACLRRQVVYLICTCLWDVWLFHSQTSHRQVHQARTHIDDITATYQINEAKQAEKVVKALSTKDDPLKMVKQLWPSLLIYLYKIYTCESIFCH